MTLKNFWRRQPFLLVFVSMLVIWITFQHFTSSEYFNLRLTVEKTTLKGGLDLVGHRSIKSELNDYVSNEEAKQIKTINRILCDNKTSTPFYSQRGSYWVLYNYIQADMQFNCHESITYATHSDFTYLDNLIPLLERWKGPLSFSIYAPASDFNETVFRILYLRECFSPLIKNLVSFHIFFDNANIPNVTKVEDLKTLKLNCDAGNKPKFGDNLTTYRKLNKLLYPVNVARNVAREMATTYYILTSDIELYPNPNLIQDFLQMVNSVSFDNENKLKVFPLSIFELEDNVTVLPNNKMELISMLNNKTAIPFHKFVCSSCHTFPKAKEWLTLPFDKKMKVTFVQKRLKPYAHWEPIYIGTNFQPLYDERLSWEGRSDKMTQGFVMCILDYEFHILNNGFLVHKPGIKRKHLPHTKIAGNQSHFIRSVIVPQIIKIYGNRQGCEVN